MDAYCSAKVLSNFTDGRLELFFEELPRNREYTVVFQEYLKYLVTAIEHLRMAFDCNVVLGGYVGPYLQDYLGEVQQMVAEKNPFESDGGYVTICRYRKEASAVGAALHYIKEFIEKI